MFFLFFHFHFYFYSILSDSKYFPFLFYFDNAAVSITRYRLCDSEQIGEGSFHKRTDFPLASTTTTTTTSIPSRKSAIRVATRESICCRLIYSREGCSFAGEDFDSVPDDKPVQSLRQGCWDISSCARYATRRVALEMHFQQFSLRKYPTDVKLRGMIDGRERSRPLIINKNESCLIETSPILLQFLSIRMCIFFIQVK